MNYEEYAAKARRMNPIDDAFFQKMAESREFCQEMLRTVLEEPCLEVIEVRPQDNVKNLQGRSVVLDAHCVLAGGSRVNVEVQKADDDDHQKRVRYYAACVTANVTDAGSRFEHVPTVCVVYITKNDFLKKGKTMYHIDRIIRETGDVVDNGLSEIYVNAYVKDGSPTSELMTIFTQDGAYDDERFPETSGRKRYFKEGKGVDEMCAIMEALKEEGRREGRVEFAVQLYRKGVLQLEDACAYLDVTEEEFRGLEEKME